MNKFLSLFAAFALTFSTPFAFAGSGGGINEKFVKTIYVKFGGSATNSGTSYDAAKSCAADADMWDIPAGTVIEKVYVIADVAITGSTALDLGDDDDPNGFFDGGISGYEGASFAAGMYGWNAKVAGADLRVETPGATNATDIYVVPNAKFYRSAGKELKLDITTACTAGKLRIVIEGFRVAP